MNWPNKDQREQFEINEFIKAYKCFSHGRDFALKLKREKPDYVLQDRRTNECFGVELTSVYLDDQSVPDAHKQESDIEDIPYCEGGIKLYKEKLFKAIKKKVEKARAGYSTNLPLILSVYVNEYISIYMVEEDWISFAKEHENFWDSMSPFIEVVFWPLPNKGIYSIKSG